jgi:hypothetical protein
MWKAFKLVFGAMLGYFFALVFIAAVIFGAGVAVAVNQSHQQQPSYHATKATRS